MMKPAIVASVATACTSTAAGRTKASAGGTQCGSQSTTPETSSASPPQTIIQKNCFWPKLNLPEGGTRSSSFLMYCLIAPRHARSAAVVFISRRHVAYIHPTTMENANPTQTCNTRERKPPPSTIASQKSAGVQNASPVRSRYTYESAAMRTPPSIARLPAHRSAPFQSVTPNGTVGFRGRPYSSGRSPSASTVTTDVPPTPGGSYTAACSNPFVLSCA